MDLAAPLPTRRAAARS